MPLKVITVYWSGYGHTKRLAEAVNEGAKTVVGVEAHLLDAEDYGDPDSLGVFEDADAIIFGSPTYMGGVSHQFKKFVDATSKPWLAQAWKNKVAGGFTNSSSLSGDKQGTLAYLAVLAAQHGMIWVGQGELPAKSTDPGTVDPSAVNRIGSFLGVIGKSGYGAEGPSEGDLETGRLYGKRVAEVADQFVRGRGHKVEREDRTEVLSGD